MNYEKLLEKHGYVHRHYNTDDSIYSEKSLLKYAKRIVNSQEELDGLGNNLTDSDYDRVSELMNEYERSYAYYCGVAKAYPLGRNSNPFKTLEQSMLLSERRKNEQEADMKRKLNEIKNGINGVEF
jgi:hypothetical protein